MLNDATLINQKLLLYRLSANIFYRLNLSKLFLFIKNFQIFSDSSVANDISSRSNMTGAESQYSERPPVPPETDYPPVLPETDYPKYDKLESNPE